MYGSCWCTTHISLSSFSWSTENNQHHEGTSFFKEFCVQWNTLGSFTSPVFDKICIALLTFQAVNFGQLSLHLFNDFFCIALTNFGQSSWLVFQRPLHCTNSLVALAFPISRFFLECRAINLAFAQWPQRLALAPHFSMK